MSGEEEPNFLASLFVYLQYAILISFGHLRDFFGKLSGYSRYRQGTTRVHESLYKNMFDPWENFYTTRVYHRIQDVFNRPISSQPGRVIDVLERTTVDGNKTLTVTPDKTTRACLNLGSYNYLGFADDWMTTCAPTVLPHVSQFAGASGTSSIEYGMTTLHVELEELVAKFLDKPKAMIFNMGYGTNSSTIPALIGKGRSCVCLFNVVETKTFHLSIAGYGIDEYEYMDIMNIWIFEYMNMDIMNIWIFEFHEYEYRYI